MFFLPFSYSEWYSLPLTNEISTNLIVEGDRLYRDFGGENSCVNIHIKSFEGVNYCNLSIKRGILSDAYPKNAGVYILYLKRDMGPFHVTYMFFFLLSRFLVA